MSSAVGYSGYKIKKKEYNLAYNELRDVVDINVSESDPYLTRARYMISCLYFEGKGIEENRELAMKYLRLSAQGGNKDATHKLQELSG